MSNTLYRVRGNLYEFPRPLSREDVLRVAEDIVCAEFYAQTTLTNPAECKAFLKAKLAKHLRLKFQVQHPVHDCRVFAWGRTISI